MFPDFINQILPEGSECCFTTSIDGNISCCKDGEFDFNGFAENICKHFPCEKFKNLFGGLKRG